MNELLNKINQLFAQGQSTEFEIRLLEKEAQMFLSSSTTAAEGYMALGLLAAIRLDEKGVDDYFSKSLHLLPNDPLVLSNYAKVQHAIGHSGAALALIERTMKLMHHEVLTSQGVHVALSALHIQQALDWQNELEKPILSIPETWLSAHLQLLACLNVAPAALTQYRDKIASVLVGKGFLVDRGWVSFRSNGGLDYTFMIKGNAIFDLSAIYADWESLVDEVLCQVVIFEARLSTDATDTDSQTT